MVFLVGRSVVTCWIRTLSPGEGERDGITRGCWLFRVGWSVGLGEVIKARVQLWPLIIMQLRK